MKFIDILRILENQDRVYSSNGWYPRYTTPCYDWIQKADLKNNYFKPQELPHLEEDEFGHRDQTLVRSLVEWGRADATVIEKHFDVQLPNWVHEFYRKVVRAVVYLRNPIVILAPQEVVEFETLRRNAHAEKLPIRQVGFAHAGISGASFAFRQSVTKQVWEIAFSSLDCTLDEEQSEQMESLVEYDSDFDCWLTRLYETDGHPMQINNSYEVCYTERER